MDDNTKTARGAESIHFDNFETKEPSSKLPAHIPPQDTNKTPQKKNIFILWLLSIITLGIFSAIWYLKRSSEFFGLGTQKKLRKNLALTFLITNIVFVTLLIIFPLTITTDMGDFYQNMSTTQIAILSLLGIAFILRIFFSLLLAFYSRTILNQALENKKHPRKTSVLFTLIFTHLYLQYEINKIIGDREETPRRAPLIFLIIIILSITLGILLVL